MLALKPSGLFFLNPSFYNMDGITPFSEIFNTFSHPLFFSPKHKQLHPLTVSHYYKFRESSFIGFVFEKIYLGTINKKKNYKSDVMN